MPGKAALCPLQTDVTPHQQVEEQHRESLYSPTHTEPFTFVLPYDPGTLISQDAELLQVITLENGVRHFKPSSM